MKMSKLEGRQPDETEKSEIEQHEDRIMAKLEGLLEPLHKDICCIKRNLESHNEEVIRLQEENKHLVDKIRKLNKTMIN